MAKERFTYAGFAAFLFLGGFLPALALAAEPNSSAAQPTQATSTEKNLELLDLETRKKILQNVFDMSLSELKNIREKLEKLQLDDPWKEPRENLLKQIPEFESFYKVQTEKLNAENAGIEDIKAQAKEIKTWRQETFSPFLKQASNLLLIFEEESILKTARARLDKISGDITKLEKQSFPKIEPLKTMLSQAQGRLMLAEELHSNAKNLLLKALTIPKTEEEIVATSTPQDLAAAESSAPISAAEEKKPAEKEMEIQDLIQDLIKNSFEDLKATYEIFIKMNKSL